MTPLHAPQEQKNIRDGCMKKRIAYLDESDDERDWLSEQEYEDFPLGEHEKYFIDDSSSCDGFLKFRRKDGRPAIITRR